MTTKNIFGKILLSGGILMGLGMTTSCEDFLTILPTNSIPEENFWTDKNDVENVRAAAYRQMASDAVVNRILYWGEFRGDNMSLNEQSNTNVRNLQDAILMPTSSIFDWASYYTTINYCNLVLSKGQEMVDNKVDPSFTNSQWYPVRAEMIGLRALSYFYLVRAYRNVPYVDKSISSDAEAMASRRGVTPGATILGNLISQLEDVKDQAAENFGSSVENKGRLNKRGIRAILADMYLWRSCMLTNAQAKGDTLVAMPIDTILVSSIQNVGDTLTTAQLTAISKAGYNRTIALADEIMAAYQKDYDELLEKFPNMNAGKKKHRYDIISYQDVYSAHSTTDQIYADIFGRGNSSESVFELQYDGTNLKNNTVTSMLASYSNSVLATKLMAGNGNLSAGLGTPDPEVGYGKTDMRLLETFNYSPTARSNPAVHKMLLSNVSISDIEDVAQGASSRDYRSESNCNWPIYRLSDIMLMKAEAIARVLPATTGVAPGSASGDTKLLQEGFYLTNAIFERSNPALKNTSATGTLKSSRLNDDYANGKTQVDLLNLVYRERQREFVAEGKRWFDIVRQCEAAFTATEETGNVLGVWNSMTNNVKNRLRKLYSLYNPIYSEEMKVNGEASGGYLKQNPVWDRYTKD